MNIDMQAAIRIAGENAALMEQRDELAAALRLALAELEAYDVPSDPMDPQRVAVEAGHAALAKVSA